MYPVMLNLQGRRCLVVGGGGVALRKVEGLLSEGAEVRVVTPNAIPSLQELARSRKIDLVDRLYQKSDVEGHILVFAATNDAGVNQKVAEDAEKAGIWVNVADEPQNCTFHLPARLRRGAFQLVIASAGEAPFVVRRLRRFLERRFGPEWSEWLEAAARFRAKVRGSGMSPEEQQICFDSFFSATVDEEQITVRVPSAGEEAGWLHGRESRKEESAKPSIPVEEKGGRSRLGFVSLVGAGPGDAGLLTLRGRQRLSLADAVVYDHLAETALPCDLSAEVELHPVGKKAGHHPVPQEEINALLLRLAREGKRVVRLKGGDPYVFGRGGEEAEALVEAGVPFEVVPSVTAAVAAPAYAGIPVTHRREVVRVTMVTAHESAKENGAQIKWDLLAADKYSTLIGYMGVTSLPKVVKQLLACGMDPDTPSAMIERGTTSRQRVVRSVLSELPEAVQNAAIRPPALFVIGPAVNHAEKLDWFESRPLFGERIVVVGPGKEIADELEFNGAEVLQVPLPISPAARVAIEALPLTGCVLSSADDVEAIDEERDGRSWSIDVVAWCLNSDASERARQLGWRLVQDLGDRGTEMRIVEEILEFRRQERR